MDKTSLQQDKQRSQLLRKQLSQMNEDFEYMKKNKEEWKKQLDARFQDIQRKIQNSKQFIINEAKRTNDTLLAFQHKFEHQLKRTNDQLNSNITKLSQDTDHRFTQKTEQIRTLQKNLEQEKQDRMTQHDEGMKENRERADKLNELIEKEKEARIQSEKDNMGKINQTLFVIKEQQKQEIHQRNLKLKELRNHIDTELSSQRKFNQEFHNKTYNDFKNSLGELRSEMEARFSSKDQIINSISKVVKTIQDTLRHPH